VASSTNLSVPKLEVFWQAFKDGITCFSDFLWNGPMTIMLLGIGLYLTFRTSAFCIRAVPESFKLLRKVNNSKEGEITPFQALSTALAATVGTGNIAGVATAIGIGGPGAIFWMWIVALLGITTKYAECLLAVHFRTKDAEGEYVGGPMHYIERGMGPKYRWLAILFAYGTILSAFVTGNMIQSNSVASAVASTTRDLGDLEAGVPTWIVGLIIAVATYLAIVGGIKSIGRIAGRLVPTMAIFYTSICLLIIVINWQAVPGAFSTIFNYAFTGSAAGGGFVGAVVIAAMRAGVARGMFSNEAGQGSAPMAHGAAQAKDPMTQARIAMLGTVIDTLIICTMTALVILTTTGIYPSADGGTVSNIWQSIFESAELTSLAFAQTIPGGSWFIAASMAVFAFTTILGYAYYGEKAFVYLFGNKHIYSFRMVWVLAIWLGAVQEVDFLWRFGDIAGAAMMAPNLIALFALSGVVVKLTQEYQQNHYN